MRIAVVSDIHGNFAALQKVISDLTAASADVVVYLGDCVFGPLWPLETFDLLQRLEWRTVCSNRDRLVGFSDDGRLGRSDSWTWAQLGYEDRQWLAMLPVSLTIEDALCALGTPSDDNAFLTEDVGGGGLTPARSVHLGASGRCQTQIGFVRPQPYSVRGRYRYRRSCGQSRKRGLAGVPERSAAVSVGNRIATCPACSAGHRGRSHQRDFPDGRIRLEPSSRPRREEWPN